jgi:hypothetical protein
MLVRIYRKMNFYALLEGKQISTFTLEISMEVLQTYLFYNEYIYERDKHIFNHWPKFIVIPFYLRVWMVGYCESFVIYPE